jgi:hypothetical protein
MRWRSRASPEICFPKPELGNEPKKLELGNETRKKLELGKEESL